MKRVTYQGHLLTYYDIHTCNIIIQDLEIHFISVQIDTKLFCKSTQSINHGVIGSHMILSHDISGVVYILFIYMGLTVLSGGMGTCFSNGPKVSNEINIISNHIHHKFNQTTITDIMKSDNTMTESKYSQIKNLTEIYNFPDLPLCQLNKLSEYQHRINTIHLRFQRAFQ